MASCKDERPLLADDVDMDLSDTLEDTLPEVSSEEETGPTPNLELPLLKIQFEERLRLLQEEQKEARKRLFETCQRLNVPTASKSFPPPRPPWVKPPPVPITMCYAHDGSRVFLFPPSISRSAREAYLSIYEEILAEVLQYEMWDVASDESWNALQEAIQRGQCPADSCSSYQLTNPQLDTPTSASTELYEDSDARWRREMREAEEQRQIILKTAPEGSTLWLEALIE